MHQVIFRVKGVINRLLHFKILQKVEFSLRRTSDKLIILQPAVISEKVILRYFGELLHRLESVLLNSPKLPMIVSTCAYLMIIFRVESDLFDLLLLQVILAEDSSLVEPIISHGFAVNSISNDEGHVLAILGKVNGSDGLVGYLMCL